MIAPEYFNNHISVEGNIFTKKYSTADEWFQGYLKSHAIVSKISNSNGDTIRTSYVDGTFNDTNSYGIGVVDTRVQGNGLGSNGALDYVPNGLLNALNNKLTPLFHYTGSGWSSSLINKGWDGNFKAWKLTGPANENDVEQDFYLSQTKASDGTWLPDRKIWTERNLDPSAFVSNTVLNNYWKIHTDFIYKGINTDSPFTVLNNGAAQGIIAGGLTVSNAYVDTQFQPADGIHSRGFIQSDEGFLNRYSKADSYNRIWSFANSLKNGLTYYHGKAASTGEGFGFHFDDISRPMVFLGQNGDVYSKQGLYSLSFTNGNSQVLNYGNPSTLYIGNPTINNIIESNNTDIAHYRNGASGIVWDSHNLDPSAFVKAPTLNNYVPYSGATQDVNLGAKDLEFDEGAISKHQNAVRVFNKVYQGYYDVGGHTGILAIKMPQASPHQTMFSIDINIYGYESRYLGKVNVAFYKYVSGAIIINGSKAIWEVTDNFPTTTARVGIGTDGYVSILLGESDTFWNGYFSFEVAKVEVKYGNYNLDWNVGWSHAIESNFDSYNGNIITLPSDVVATRSWLTNFANNSYIPKAVQYNNNFNNIGGFSTSGVYRANNDEGGVQHLYSPMLHMGAQDTTAQLQVKYNDGDVATAGELVYRGGFNGKWTPWRKAWDNVNFKPSNYQTRNTDEIVSAAKTYYNRIPFILKNSSFKSWAINKPTNNNLKFVPSSSNNAEDWDYNNNIEFTDGGQVLSKGFNKIGYNDNYILTAGGGHRLASDFISSSELGNYLRKDGGTLTGSLNMITSSTIGTWRSTAITGNYMAWQKYDGSKAIAYIGADAGSALSGGTGDNFVIRVPNGGDLLLGSDSGNVLIQGATPWTTNNFNPDSKVNAIENAHTLGFSNGLSAGAPYIYHKTDGYVFLATQNWTNGKFVNLDGQQDITGLKVIKGRARNTGTGWGNTAVSNDYSFLVETESGSNTDNQYTGSIGFFSNSGAQAGIYVRSNDQSGTSMAFATTDVFASGPQIAMTIDNYGSVNHVRKRPTFQGNVIWDAGNLTTSMISNWNNKFKDLKFVGNLNLVSESGIYRQESPSSGFYYTTTLNLNSADGRQQLTIDRAGNGMRFRGSTSGSGDNWGDWRTVWSDLNFSQASIDSWNYMSNYGIIVNQPFTNNTGNGLMVVDSYNGGESGIYSKNDDSYLAVSQNEYYKYSSGYKDWDGINFNKKNKNIGIGTNANDADKVNVLGSVKAVKNFKSEDEKPNTLFIPDGSLASLDDEITNEDSRMRLSHRMIEQQPGVQYYDSDSRMLAIRCRDPWTTFTLKECYPGQRILVLNTHPKEVQEFQIEGSGYWYRIPPYTSIQLFIWDVKSIYKYAENKM